MVCTYIGRQWHLQQRDGDVGRERHLVTHATLEGQSENSHTSAFAEHWTLHVMSLGLENSILSFFFYFLEEKNYFFKKIVYICIFMCPFVHE